VMAQNNFKNKIGGGSPLKTMQRLIVESQENVIKTIFILDFTQRANCLMTSGN
ncbi:unnamed protein product, partial [marine sediment metagenome]